MTETTAPADGTRWRGYSHRDLYQMLHDGPGAAASAAPSRRWGEVAATLTEIGQDLQQAITLTGGGWTGRAAGAAYDRLSTTVAWAAEAGASAATMRVSVEDQGDHIAKARADMPAPEDTAAVQPDPAVAPAVQVIQAQTDAEPAEAAASAAAERAVEVMTTYETNTGVTTAALATFDMPEKLLPSSNMHQNQGGGLLGLAATVVAGLTGGSRRDHHRDDRRGGGPRGDHHQPPTTGSSAPGHNRRPATSAQAPAKFTGVSTDPFLSAGGRGLPRDEEHSASRGNSGGSSGGGAAPPAPGVKSGASALQPAEIQQQAQHAAAASQAAASAHPGAPGAPIAPTTGTVGGQDKMGLRRFGMDAIGSSQWFGDTEEPVPGQAPRRRFDLRESTEVPEAVSILDEEHQLPPNVIGEGGR